MRQQLWSVTNTEMPLVWETLDYADAARDISLQHCFLEVFVPLVFILRSFPVNMMVTIKCYMHNHQLSAFALILFQRTDSCLLDFRHFIIKIDKLLLFYL